MVSSACADSQDFQLDDGKLQLLPHTLRSATVAFTHLLDGPDGVLEEITEIAPLVIPANGAGAVPSPGNGGRRASTPTSDAGCDPIRRT